MQARLPNGGTLSGGWFTDRTQLVTCDTNDPNQLRFCDQTGELFQELGSVPGMPFRHEYKLAATYPLPWRLQPGLSFVSFPNGSHLSVDWAVPANLFPGGRTVPVTVNLIPPGTKHLKRWNQLDVSLKRVIQLARVELDPTVEVFNLLNSSVVLSQLTAFGPALDRPGQTLNGRFVKVGARLKF
jgi:hypothetical protein